MAALLWAAFLECKKRNRSPQTCFMNVAQQYEHFSPCRWFSSPLQQTILSRMLMAPRIPRKIHLIPFKDGTKCRLDVFGEFSNPNVALLFPGLSGSYKSAYATHFAKAGVEAGFTVVIYTRRAHCPESISPTYPKHYDLSDLNDVFEWMDTSFPPDKKLFGVGVSCGANQVIKYAGETGKDCKFTKIVSVSNGFDLNKVIHHSLYGDPTIGHVFSSFALEILENVIGGKSIKKTTFSQIEYEALKAFTASNASAPSNMTEYYDEMSSIHSIPHVEIPLLCINSLDDPFYVLDKDFFIDLIEKNKNVSVILTTHGGHAGNVDRNYKCDWWCKNATLFLQSKS